MTSAVTTSYPSKQKSATFEIDLEGLRGFAAVLVIWCHAIGMPHYLDPAYNPTGILGYQAPAHFCVLIFFVLSGYVIGISTKSQLTIATVSTYLRKRFLRIYPIYLLATLLALLVATTLYSWRVVVGNLLFLHVVKMRMIDENSPSWSLQYEVCYYLAFIPLSMFRLNAIVVILACLLLGFATVYFWPDVPLIASYAFGFVFWCSGLALSHYARHWPRFQPSYRVLLSVLLLFLSFPTFTLGAVVSETIYLLGKHEFTYPAGLNMYHTMLPPLDLTYLIYAMGGVLVFTHKQFPYRALLLPSLLLISGLGFISMILNWASLDHAWCLVTSLAYLASLGTYFTRFRFLEILGKHLITSLIKIGSFSYGLYIIHMPILFIFKHIITFSGSGTSYWVRFILFILIAFSAAYVLEKIFQPWVRARLEYVLSLVR
jgi:peptidoglycan/LPS O-acetylase OafA/YrhL